MTDALAKQGNDKVSSEPMRVVSLFSGAGGLDLGFIQAGFKVVWANDLYKDAVATYRKNIGDHIVCEDVAKIDSATIPACDIVIGGFPCQGFSVANTKRHETDKRNTLYLQLLRVIKDKQPKFFELFIKNTKEQLGKIMLDNVSDGNLPLYTHLSYCFRCGSIETIQRNFLSITGKDIFLKMREHMGNSDFQKWQESISNLFEMRHTLCHEASAQTKISRNIAVQWIMNVEILIIICSKTIDLTKSQQK